MNSDNYKIRRADIILLTAIIAAAVMIYFIYRLSNSTPGQKVVITVDGSVTAELMLNADMEYRIKGTNGYDTLAIRDGEVRMLEADCPDQICVKHRAIHASGESIVCLPNRIAVEIQGLEDTALDGYTGH